MPAESLVAQSGAVKSSDTVSLSGEDVAGFLTAVIDRHLLFRFTARGQSMHPFIRDGDVLTVAPLDQAPTTGDVVAVRHPHSQQLLVHRVVACLAAAFVVRGDNALEPDGVAASGDVLGLVCRVERRGRRVRVGQGTERRALAALSARGRLVPLVALAFRTRRVLLRAVPGMRR